MWFFIQIKRDFNNILLVAGNCGCVNNLLVPGVMVLVRGAIPCCQVPCMALETLSGRANRFLADSWWKALKRTLMSSCKKNCELCGCHFVRIAVDLCLRGTPAVKWFFIIRIFQWLITFLTFFSPPNTHMAQHCLVRALGKIAKKINVALLLYPSMGLTE